jgi:hypothetical protein
LGWSVSAMPTRNRARHFDDTVRVLEAICVRSQRPFDAVRPLDIGLLAEAMLYYGRTTLILTPGLFTQLLDKCGAETLVRLVEQPDLDVCYLDGGTGVLTENTNTLAEEHKPIVYRLPDWELEGYTVRELQRVTGRQGKGRRFAHRLLNNIRPLSIDRQVIEEAIGDFQDRPFVERVAHRLVAVLAPSYALPADAYFIVNKKRVDERGVWFSVDSNIDWGAATRSWQDYSAHENALSAAYVLTSALSVQENLYFASLYSADIAVDAVHSMLIEERCRALLQARRGHTILVAEFQENVLGSSRAVAEAINSDERTVAELLDLLPHARRFRTWVAGQEPDESLVQNYIGELTASAWLQRLPIKTIRWVMVTASGALGALLGADTGFAVGATAGLFDSLLIERMIGGWRPNRFVDGRLRPFVGGDR